MASSGTAWWQLPGLVLIFLLALVPMARGAVVDEWTVQTTPAPPFSTETKLAGVSCWGSQCTAVGFSRSPASGGLRATLAERWNGSSWAIQTIPNPLSEEASLAGVSCATESRCVAVGLYKTSTVNPLAEVWNGSTWTIQLPLLPEKALEARLEAISCPPISTVCTAVGYYKNSASEIFPLAERWNGEKWTIQATPTPAGAEKEAALKGVTCATPSVCNAVGYYKSGGVYKPLAQTWNSVKWEAQTPPSPAGALEAKLSSMTCVVICHAVGQYKNASGTKVTLAERLKSGTWEVVTTPNPAGATEASLKGVSCVAETKCLSVGSSLSPSASTLAEIGNGTGWELTSPVNPTGSEQELTAVACISGKTCMAAGSYKSGSTPVPLTELAVRWETPVNTTVPTVSPSAPETGKAVTTTNGTWSNEPTSYAYLWKRCNASGLECLKISGATNSAYTPTAADVGLTLVAEVTASNLAGSASAVSKATEKVK